MLGSCDVRIYVTRSEVVMLETCDVRIYVIGSCDVGNCM